MTRVAARATVALTIGLVLGATGMPARAQLSTKPGGVIHGRVMLESPEPMPTHAARPHAKPRPRPHPVRSAAPSK